MVTAKVAAQKVQWSAEEAKAREELSAAHKLVRLFNMDELVWNHMSLRLADGSLLLTPGEKLFDDIGPEDLKKSSDNVTADIIHSAVYKVRPDVKAIVHLHTPAATAVSCLESGFDIFSQDGAMFFEKVAYHDWEGISDDPAECERLGAAVKGGVNSLLMRNHGFCTFGRSIAEAWVLAYYFEAACQTQLAVLSTRQPIRRPKAEVLRKARAQYELPEFVPGACEWDALLRLARKPEGGLGNLTRSPRGGTSLALVDRAARQIQGPQGSEAVAGGGEPDEESKLRDELVAAHKLTMEFGLDMLVWNHISARLSSGEVLITPGRRMYHEIELGDVLKSSGNVTADTIHTAVYAARPDVRAVVHLHTPAATAVACLESGFHCLAQHSAAFHGRVAYHDWEGLSDDPEEAPRLAAVVKGDVNVLVMRNHGFCTLGRSLAEAWVLAFYFEKSCETQISVLQSGQALRRPSEQVLAHAAKQAYLPGFAPGDSEWPALVRLAKRRRLADAGAQDDGPAMC